MARRENAKRQKRDAAYTPCRTVAASQPGGFVPWEEEPWFESRSSRVETSRLAASGERSGLSVLMTRRGSSAAT